MPFVGFVMRWIIWYKSTIETNDIRRRTATHEPHGNGQQTLKHVMVVGDAWGGGVQAFYSVEALPLILLFQITNICSVRTGFLTSSVKHHSKAQIITNLWWNVQRAQKLQGHFMILTGFYGLMTKPWHSAPLLNKCMTYNHKNWHKLPP